MKLIENFDTWNRLYESRLAKSTARPLNEADDMFAKIMEGIKSSMAYAKATGMMKKWAELSKAANADIIALEVAKKAEALRKRLEPLGKQKAEAKGQAAKAQQQEKIDQVRELISEITERGEEKKQQAANEKEAFKETLDDLQKQMKEPFSDLYAKQLSEVNRAVLLEAAKAKGELAAAKGKETAAAEAKQEAATYAAELDKIRKDLAEGKNRSKEDLEELDELKPFLNEIEKIQSARANVEKENTKIDGDTASGVETAAGDDPADQRTALEELKAKLTKKKTAQEGLHDAVKQLYDKVQAAQNGVTKTIVAVAGGNREKAVKQGDGWKIGELNSAWGKKDDLEKFIDKEEYTANTQKAIEDCDTKLSALQQPPETNSYNPNVSGAYQVSESIATRFKRAMDQKGPRL